jgi:hypothetical protein
MVTIQTLPRMLACGVAAAVIIAASAGRLSAQTFHIKEADFEARQWTVESINAALQGFPDNAERKRTGHEVGVGYGITAAWQLKGLISFDTPDQETTRLKRAIMENVVVLRALEENKNGTGVAWFQAVEAAIVRDETNATIFGPIITTRAGKTELALNPFFEKSFGQNHTRGIDFVYGWQARHELNEHVSIGFEGYGRIPDLGNGVPLSFQEHRIGPVLILKSAFDSAPGPSRAGALTASPAGRAATADLELGVLFGLTEATSDLAFKANVHFNY